MSERYLQSLAILLAGLFSAERFRSSGRATGLLRSNRPAEPNRDPVPTCDAAARAKENQH
jgi:hypothetical protein